MPSKWKKRNFMRQEYLLQAINCTIKTSDKLTPRQVFGVEPQVAGVLQEESLGWALQLEEKRIPWCFQSAWHCGFWEAVGMPTLRISLGWCSQITPPDLYWPPVTTLRKTLYYYEWHLPHWPSGYISKNLKVYKPSVMGEGMVSPRWKQALMVAVFLQWKLSDSGVFCRSWISAWSSTNRLKRRREPNSVMC